MVQQIFPTVEVDDDVIERVMWKAEMFTRMREDREDWQNFKDGHPYSFFRLSR